VRAVNNIIEMKEFQVNDYITLKLEGEKTVIFVAGERFRQCKYLLLDIPVEKIESFAEIKSIDEAAEKLDHSLENRQKQVTKIPPDIEFWAHCSNLQVWYEHNYDTSLLHSNLAFPLLKKLNDEGDVLAKRVFKEEIAKRLRIGSSSVVLYLYEKDFINYLSREEFWNIFGKDGEFLFEIEQQIKKFEIIDKKKVYKKNIDAFDYFLLKSEISFHSGPMVFTLEKGRITRIGICGNEREVWEDSHYELDVFNGTFGNIELEYLPESINRLGELKELVLRDIGLKSLPKSIMKLKKLKILSITSNPQFILPNYLWNLKSLEILDLSNNKLITIPKSIENLENLRELILYSNCIESFPKKSIEKLKNLKTIKLEKDKYLNSLDNETLEWLKKY